MPPMLMTAPSQEASPTSMEKDRGVSWGDRSLGSMGDSHPRAMPWQKVISVAARTLRSALWHI